MAEVGVGGEKRATHYAIRENLSYSLGGSLDLAMISLRQVSDDPIPTLDQCNSLLCPRCECGYLHHDGVLIWHREEDQETGTLVVSVPSQTKIFEEASMKGCPSPRRDAVTIQFWCEQCLYYSMLDIIQHKGSTYLEWGLTDDQKDAPGS